MVEITVVRILFTLRFLAGDEVSSLFAGDEASSLFAGDEASSLFAGDGEPRFLDLLFDRLVLNQSYNMLASTL